MATTRLATATHLLTWLAGRDVDLADLRQPDLDEYLAEHPSRRPYLPAFLSWAHRTRRTPRLRLTTRPKRPPRSVAADDDQRWTLARALLHDDGYTATDRVAGLLVLLFGQRPHRISRLTTSHVNIDEDRATVTLGTSPIDLPEPLASHLKALVAARRARTGKHVTTPGPWLFPSQHPDRPPLPETITHRLQRIGIQPTAQRTAALLHLASELPPALIADLLGLGRTATQEWSTLAARPWASYVADRLDDPPDAVPAHAIGTASYSNSGDGGRARNF